LESVRLDRGACGLQEPDHMLRPSLPGGSMAPKNGNEQQFTNTVSGGIDHHPFFAGVFIT